MNLLFWKNISDLGEDVEMIRDNSQLADFNRVYDSYSLFHYFASKVDVIEMIHNRFKDAIENNQLTDKDKNMPLVLLHPDING